LMMTLILIQHTLPIHEIFLNNNLTSLRAFFFLGSGGGVLFCFVFQYWGLNLGH
jgi:hypothetical protein